LPPNSLAFTCCQVPVCYRLAKAASITIESRATGTQTIPGQTLPRSQSREIFARSGEIIRLVVEIPQASLCD
jgi:hypothetical protein